MGPGAALGSGLGHQVGEAVPGVGGSPASWDVGQFAARTDAGLNFDSCRDLLRVVFVPSQPGAEPTDRDPGRLIGVTYSKPLRRGRFVWRVSRGAVPRTRLMPN